MVITKESLILVENTEVESVHLGRKVKVDFYCPVNVRFPEEMSLLFINDGQDMVVMDFESMLNNLYEQKAIKPVLCVAVHAGPERKMEYGTASHVDFKGRGEKAGAYTCFILTELLPLVQIKYHLPHIRQKAFAGFSLGALSALDIVWNHPGEFSAVGVFSGSLWWRSKDQHDKEYDDDKHRIMHQIIRKSTTQPQLKFFFESGRLDEQRDRNKNGVIDSIDDTLDLISELKAKGYTENDIEFLLLEEGKHDVATWAKAMPLFLKWAFGIVNRET
jgi:enterochelin esterase-like enzyme